MNTSAGVLERMHTRCTNMRKGCCYNYIHIIYIHRVIKLQANQTKRGIAIHPSTAGFRPGEALLVLYEFFYDWTR